MSIFHQPGRFTLCWRGLVGHSRIFIIVRRFPRLLTAQFLVFFAFFRRSRSERSNRYFGLKGIGSPDAASLYGRASRDAGTEVLTTDVGIVAGELIMRLQMPSRNGRGRASGKRADPGRLAAVCGCALRVWNRNEEVEARCRPCTPSRGRLPYAAAGRYAASPPPVRPKFSQTPRSTCRRARASSSGKARPRFAPATRLSRSCHAF